MTKLIFICVLLSLKTGLFCQDFACIVKLHSKHMANLQIINTDKKLKSIKARFNSIGFQESYPNAKNKELLLYYDCKGKGDVTNAIKELSGLGLFEFVELDEDSVHIFMENCANPVQINDTWATQNMEQNYAIELIGAECAWTISKGSPDIIIGIADTEFEDTHDDLKNQITKLTGISSSNVQHGTWTSGTAAAETNNNIGIAAIGYNSKINAHRVPHKPNGTANSSSDLKTAIWNLYLDGVRIINVSWSSIGGIRYEALMKMLDNGVVLVLAAGNKPDGTSHSSYSDYPGVILVSGVNKDNMHGPTNHARNKWIDICAPSKYLATTLKNNNYGIISGTSFAAPIVAGTIALMLEVNPCLTNGEIEQLLKASASPIADGSQFEGLIGAGCLNAYEALKLAGTRTINDTILSGEQDLSAGYGFNLTNVTINNNSSINLNARMEVNINNNFEVSLGSNFNVNMDSSVQTDCQ